MDIKLKELEKEDIEMVRNWRNSTEVSSYLYSNNIISGEQQVKWFEKNRIDSSCKYWIIMFDGKPLGLASLTEISKVFDSCYWAFYIGDTSVRGQGIGSKVEYNVLKYVFEELNLNKLRCEVFVSNDNVIKMHEKFGFRREAFYREHCLKDEKYLDVVGLAMTKKEWQDIKHVKFDKIYGQVK
jgi:UDP-4-amino-4,6-dideoxy-N-acetyl-beta-L-altrosamine N-acetyltransferase